MTRRPRTRIDGAGADRGGQRARRRRARIAALEERHRARFCGRSGLLARGLRGEQRPARERRDQQQRQERDQLDGRLAALVRGHDCGSKWARARA